MKVVLINRSDSQGGAAVVSLRLIDALCQAGVDARMLVIDQQTDNAHVQAVGGKWANKWNFLAERLGIFVRNGFNRETLFKIDNAAFGINLSKHPWVKNADVIILAWVNQGMLSVKSVAQLGKLDKPILWVMHDMWNCTGVCHHAYECPKYLTTCESCPIVGKSGSDLSTSTQRRKAALYGSTNIHFVAVSHWLEGVCRKSSLMKDCNIHVIPNAFPIEQFNPERIEGDFRDIPADKKVVIMGARRLDEEVKGFDQLIAATQYIAQNKPELAQKLHLLLYGGIKDETLLQQIDVPYTYVGMVGGAQLSELYRHSDIVVSTSRYETLPGTLIEGQAAGCIPVTYGKGGQPDIVDHLKSGYIAEYQSPESVSEGLEWAATQPVSRQFLHDEVARKFSADAVAGQFIQLIQEIL